MLTDGRLAAAVAIFCTGLLFTCIETNAQSMPKDVAARTEIYAIPSLTISDQQFLTGDANGWRVRSGSFTARLTTTTPSQAARPISPACRKPNAMRC